MARRFFYDCEFMEDSGDIELISIGVVDESGDREFYACNLDADLSNANQWVREHVLPQLPYRGYDEWMYLDQIADRLRAFLAPTVSDPVELWGYYSAYDHVALCSLWGSMVDLPKGMPMLTLDIQQEAQRLGLSRHDLPPDSDGEHDALVDARWNRVAWKRLQEISRVKEGEVAEENRVACDGESVDRKEKKATRVRNMVACLDPWQIESTCPHCEASGVLLSPIGNLRMEICNHMAICKYAVSAGHDIEVCTCEAICASKEPEDLE